MAIEYPYFPWSSRPMVAEARMQDGRWEVLIFPWSWTDVRGPAPQFCGPKFIDTGAMAVPIAGVRFGHFADPGWSAAPAGWWARMKARPNPSRRLRSGGGWNVRRRGRIGSDGLGGRLLDVPDFTN